MAGATEAEALPAFGEAIPGTLLYRLDRDHAERQAEREAAWAAKVRALEARGVVMIRAIERGELDSRSIKPDPPRWSARRTVPAEEPADRGGLDWARWNAARNPRSSEDFEREAAAVKADHWRRLSTGPDRRVIAVRRSVPWTGPPALRPLRADRTRRESPARTVSRGGDSGDSSDSDEPEPPGVAPGGDLKHVSGVLGRYVAELRSIAASRYASGLPP